MKLRRLFRVAYGTAATKTNYFVEVGKAGWGEASGSVYYGPSPEEISADIQKGAKYIESIKKPDIACLNDLNRLEINPPAKFALTTGLLHYLSDHFNRFPWEIAQLPKPDTVRTSFTVSINTPEAMIEEINNAPYPIIKIKMGFDEDEKLLEGLRQITGKSFRVDANGGWTPDKAERMIFSLSKLGIEIIEQPTKPEFAKDWKYLRGSKKVSIFIDEGMNNLEDYEKYADYVDGINIKLAKAGGILEAKAMGEKARRDKIKVMLGCMVESSIAIAPAVYMSSLADYFDLDGPLLLEQDSANELNFDVDKINLNENIVGGPKMNDAFQDASR